MNLHSANVRRRRAHRKRVLKEARVFHENMYLRLGPRHPKLVNSGYVRRHRKGRNGA